MGALSGSFIGPIILGLYSKNTTKVGAWAGMLGGILTIDFLRNYKIDNFSMEISQEVSLIS